MKPVIFAGPTVGEADILDLLDADVLPPVAQGDVYRVARQGPSAIGIIDGYFDGVPSVWHKEILWAIEHGIPVFGSASMGALRAAELSEFGMIGIGGIFEAYRAGDIADDDEVAVLHGPAELGFVALSEPMVSVRATVQAAKDARVITDDAADLVNETAKSMHYRDRTWEGIATQLGDDPRLSVFLEWLPDGKVDAKRADAGAMLAQMAAFLRNDPDGVPKAYRVERTLAWQGLVRRIDAENEARPTISKSVLDELRLDPERYEALRDRAVLRHLAVEDAARRGLEPDRDTLRTLMDRHRRQQNLSRREDILGWLDENDLDEASYEAFLGEAALIDEVADLRSARLEPHILSELRWSGAYSGLKARAEAKALVIDENSSATASPDRLRLLIWYFETRLGRSVPDDLDAYAGVIGLAGRDELFALIAREFIYSLNDTERLAVGQRD